MSLASSNQFSSHASCGKAVAFGCASDAESCDDLPELHGEPKSQGSDDASSDSDEGTISDNGWERLDEQEVREMGLEVVDALCCIRLYLSEEPISVGQSSLTMALTMTPVTPSGGTGGLPGAAHYRRGSRMAEKKRLHVL